MDITEFLTARYDEEWELAGAAMTDHYGIVYDHARFQDEFESHDGESTVEQRAFINHFDPRHTFADIAVKRAVVELHQPKHPADTWHWLTRECAGCGGRWHKWIADRPPTEIGPEQGCQTIRLLAQPYADHPDFDPAWRTA